LRIFTARSNEFKNDPVVEGTVFLDFLQFILTQKKFEKLTTNLKAKKLLKHVLSVLVNAKVFTPQVSYVRVRVY